MPGGRGRLRSRPLSLPTLALLSCVLFTFLHTFPSPLAHAPASCGEKGVGRCGWALPAQHRPLRRLADSTSRFASHTSQLNARYVCVRALTCGFRSRLLPQHPYSPPSNPPPPPSPSLPLNTPPPLPSLPLPPSLPPPPPTAPLYFPWGPGLTQHRGLRSARRSAPHPRQSGWRASPRAGGTDRAQAAVSAAAEKREALRGKGERRGASERASEGGMKGERKRERGRGRESVRRAARARRSRAARREGEQ